MRPYLYILEGHSPVPVPVPVPVTGIDVLHWAEWFEAADRRVAIDIIDEIKISTVFIGIDHNFSEQGPPLLFETLVFFGQDGGVGTLRRYPTWDAAATGHRAIVNETRHYWQHASERTSSLLGHLQHTFGDAR